MHERLVLHEGLTLRRPVHAGRGYRFSFSVPTGTYLQLRVEQIGVDVGVRLSDAAGALVYEVDSPNGAKGSEPVFAVTRKEGEHTLDVAPLKEGAEGELLLRVEALRPALLADRRRSVAEGAWARAELRRLERSPGAAATAYRTAGLSFAALGEPERSSAAYWHLGEALFDLDRPREAQQVLAVAASGFRLLGDAVGEARAAVDLGNALRLLGESAAARAALARAVDLYRASDRSAGEATAWNDLALVAEDAGDLEAAADAYAAALALWRRRKDTAGEARTVENLGSLYTLVGRDEEAVELLRRAVELAGDRDGLRLTALIALGWAEHCAGRSAAALERYAEAQALSSSRRLDAAIADRRGSALLALGRMAEAEASYRRAFDLLRGGELEVDRGHTLANLGALHFATGELGAARRELTTAAEVFQRAGDGNAELATRTALGRVLRRAGESQRALDELESGVRIVEQLRGGLRAGLSRETFLGSRYQVYEELAALHLELERREPGRGHAERGLEVAERARAASLREAAAQARAAVPDPLAGRRAELLGELRRLDVYRRLAGPAIRGTRSAETEETFREGWLALDRAAPPAPASALEPLSAEAIRALVDPDTLLVVYLLADPRSLAWTIDRDGVVAYDDLPPRGDVEDLAQELAELLPRSRVEPFRSLAEESARRLSAAVLDPLAPRLNGYRRLAFIPDGALHLIPLAMLPEPGGEGPLLLRHDTVVLPSATFLGDQRRVAAVEAPPPDELAVFADAVFSAADPRLRGGPPEIPAALERTLGDLGLQALEPLPHTAEEARRILDLVPAGRRLAALDFDATRRLALSGTLSRYRMLHFATHGLVDPLRPELSGVVLSLIDRQGHREDGFLRAYEIARLDLHADLVVLSACRTALGRAVRGEGLLGLTQAFLQAGARRVVASHWNVDDRATAELMARFYTLLATEHLPPSAALAAAQRSMRAEQRWDAPYDWAPFTLVGDWR